MNPHKNRVKVYLEDGRPTLTYIINHQCNNNCSMCIRAPSFRKLKEPSTEEVLQFISKLKKNIRLIFISGGEPTLRQDLFLILNHIRNELPDTHITLLTNARMFCYEDYTKRLIDLKLPKFGIYANLSGHIPELHDKITNAPGSFTQTIAGIENLLKYNVNVEIRIVINRINYKFLPQIAEYLSIKFPNIPTIAFIAMNIVGNARINAKKVSIRYDEMVPYLERALDIILAKKINTRLYSFPLCVLKQKYRKFAKRIIFYKDKVQFLPQCEYCKCRKMCFGIWKSYIKEINDGEFKAIN